MAQVNYNEPPPSGGGDGHGGIYAILIIVVILILAVALYFGGVFNGTQQGAEELDANVTIEQPVDVPDVSPPDVDINAPNIEVPDTVTIQ